MAVGRDESGKFYVVSGPPGSRRRLAGPFDAVGPCRDRAKAKGLGGALVALAGHTVVGGEAGAEDLVEAGIVKRAQGPNLLAVLTLGARDAATAIGKAGYDSEQTAALIAAEQQRERPRVTVLRALGVEV